MKLIWFGISRSLGKRKYKGFTLIEAIVATLLITLATVGALSIMIATLNLWQKGASGTSANSYASLAMRKLVLNIEEGKSATILDTYTEDGILYGRQLRVTFPYYDAVSGSYVRTVNGETALYYLSGATGTEGSGTSLWKSVGTSRTLLAKNIESLRFAVTNGVLVRINLKGRDPEHGAVSPSFLQQSVRLRNG